MIDFLNPKKIPALFIGFLAFQGCFADRPYLPEHVRKTDHLIVLENVENPARHIEFEKELVFEDSLFLDQIHDIEIDDSGRVYIAGKSWQKRQIHIFDPDGTRTDSLGTFGTEFGEFLGIDRVQLMDETLYIFDYELSRVTFYDIEHKTFADTLSFDVHHVSLPAGLNPETVHTSPLSAVNNGRILLAAKNKRNPAYQPEGTVRYFTTDMSGRPAGKELLAQPDLLYLIGDYAGRPSPFTLPLPERPLFDISQNSELLFAHTSEFFIQIFDENGARKKAFYYPFTRRTLDPEVELYPAYSHNKQLQMTRESAKYPEKWPALFSMLTDDQNRIWVSTIADNLDEFEWWVIDQDEGMLLGRFMLPADRQILKVKNGSAYLLEKNTMGFMKVVKYRLL